MEGESPTLRVSFKNLLLVKPMQYSHIHRTDSNEENHDAIDNDAEITPQQSVSQFESVLFETFGFALNAPQQML